MGVIVIRSAARDADAACRLAAALRRHGQDCYFGTGEDDGGPGGAPAANTDGTHTEEDDGRVMVALWSCESARAAFEDRGEVRDLLDDCLNGLAADRCVLAALERGGEGENALPYGFRDLPHVDLSRWHSAGDDSIDEGPLQDLILTCHQARTRATAERAPEPVPGPREGTRLARQAEIWNALAVVTGGLFSLFAMAGITASGLIGANAGSRVWVEDLIAQGPEGWIPVSFALGAAVLFGIAGWFAAIGLFAGAGLLSVRPIRSPIGRNGDEGPDLGHGGSDAMRDVTVIHGPGNAREADILALDLHRLGLTVTPNPAQGNRDAKWLGPSLRAIRASDVVLLIGTASTFRSERVFRELLTARHYGRPVLPLLVEPMGVPGPWWSVLEGRPWIRVDDCFGGLMTQDLQDALRSLLQEPEREPPFAHRALTPRPVPFKLPAQTPLAAREPALLLAAGQ